MSLTKKTAKKVIKSQDDLPSNKQEEKLKKSTISISTPRPYLQKSTTADIYSRQNSALKTPKKPTQPPLKTNISPMKDLLKPSTSTSDLKSKKILNLNSNSPTPKIARTAKNLPFSNVTINSPIARRKLNLEAERTNERGRTKEVSKKLTESKARKDLKETPTRKEDESKKERNVKQQIQRNEVLNKETELNIQKEVSRKELEREGSNGRQRSHTRTLGEDEVKVLTPEIVDNNAEMLKLSKILNAKPKAFYVDLEDEKKPQKESDSEVSYEDDFESYESDFESYHSSKSTSEEEIQKEDQEKEIQKEENMLDSGTYDLRDRSKPQPMDFILEDSDKKTSLTDEGFQDMSSSSVSSMKTVHVDVLERPLFIDFTKSKENRRKKRIFEKLKQRAKDILSMITLHEMSFSLFEMKPIPYDLYMATFGRSNYMQVAVQTFDDGITVEVQTEEIEYGNKWTQHPIEFSKNRVHINTDNKIKNRDEIETKIGSIINFQTTCNESEIKGHYQSNPLRIFLEQKDGSGNDKMLPYDTYSAKIKQIDYSVTKLRKFLKKVNGPISNILSKNSGNTVTTNLISTSKYPFSNSYIKISSKNIVQENKFLNNTKILNILFSETKANLIITIHNTNLLEYKCILCIWDLSVAILKPLKLLVAKEIVDTGVFRGSSDGIFVGGLKDGTVQLWDLAEESNCNFYVRNTNTQEDTKNIFSSGNFQASAFTSSASNMDLKHALDSIVSLEYIDGNTVTLENGNKMIGQVCTLYKRGILIFYSIIQEKLQCHDPGKAYWSKMKLEKYQTINLIDSLVPYETDLKNNVTIFNLNSAKKRLITKRKEKNLLQNISRAKSAKIDRPRSAAIVKKFEDLWETGVLCTALKIMKIKGSDNYLVGKNCGEILVCKRFAGNFKIDRFCVTGDSSSITVLEISPKSLAYFLAATNTGTIHLCSLLEMRVLLTLDSRNTPVVMTEKCQADSKGRYIGSVPVKQIYPDEKYMENKSITSLVWSPWDPFEIIVENNSRIAIWKLTHSDIYPYKIYENTATKCVAKDRNIAFLTTEGVVEVYKINQENDKNMNVFQKYISLL